ncbi:hypothetical protein L6164_020467 [Bauhinia variegata]|uniref:Uncharacterized protein n=1 Tax=Bauhinia variegata TaxID=167791 RepID=A0ACB9MV46_BAUVA|nr:hypothetical protein L6164_020467 [Bauhinia variegata]
MSLNCLTCQLLMRTDSEREYEGVQEKSSKILRVKVDRSWSGDINSPDAKTRNRLRGNITEVVGSPGSPEPRLVRSSGMRRDWSFDEVAEKKVKRVRFR